MCKRVEAKVIEGASIRRGRRSMLYLVKYRYYVSILGWRIWVGDWKNTWKRFASRIPAALLAFHIEEYLKGEYKPK